MKKQSIISMIDWGQVGMLAVCMLIGAAVAICLVYAALNDPKCSLSDAYAKRMHQYSSWAK